ncbi:site-specific integrase [Prescottella agglutinans]|uniref:site-specific integrase n=1 Tax=Prescottella agglutinans TaxID=1644129 RepID=UPI003D976C95
MDPYLGEGWWLDFHDVSKPRAGGLDCNLPDPAVLAKENGATDGTPFFVGPDGRADSRVNRFWRDPTVRGLSMETKRRYAFSLKVWLNFLTVIGVNWDRADAATLASFKEWRMSAVEADANVSATAFRVDLAALRRFYDWASMTCSGVTNPIRFRRTRLTVNGDREARMEAAPSGVRRSDVKWLTPSAFRQWRDIGLRGFTVDGLPSPSWSGRVEDRNVAFVDGLFGTGLRCGEWSSVLTIEIPEIAAQPRLQRTWLADACAKRGAGRLYWLPRRVGQAVQFYVREGSRAEVVVRAQREERYGPAQDLLIVENATDRGVLTVRVNGRTRRMDLNALTPRIRMRLYRESDAGLEPLWLWLNHDGLPRPKAAWNRTFTVANDRVSRLLSRETHRSPSLWARPHMLRHSFALRWYSIATFVAWQRTSGLTAVEQRDFRNQLGDVWFLLATLLGHRSAETTRNVYLEPFQSLQIANLVAALEPEDRAALERLVDVVGDEHSRVVSAVAP